MRIPGIIGSISHRNGACIARWRDPDGRQRAKSFETDEQATAWLQAIPIQRTSERAKRAALELLDMAPPEEGSRRIANTPGTLRDVIAGLAQEYGYRNGSHLENAVAVLLGKYKAPPAMQQYPAGRYRLDFAWPDGKVAIEADGWLHEIPEQAAKDVLRDSWLRSEGWIVQHVDDRFGPEALELQVVRAMNLFRPQMHLAEIPSIEAMRRSGWLACIERGHQRTLQEKADATRRRKAAESARRADLAARRAARDAGPDEYITYKSRNGTAGDGGRWMREALAERKVRA